MSLLGQRVESVFTHSCGAAIGMHMAYSAWCTLHMTWIRIYSRFTYSQTVHNTKGTRAHTQTGEIWIEYRRDLFGSSFYVFNMQGQGRPVRPSDSTLEPTCWPLQDSLSLQSFCARINLPFIAPPTCTAYTIAPLLHDACAIYDPPPTPLLYAMHHACW